jgi:hypothetical protein
MESAMKSLLCPISPMRLSEATVRLTGLLMAALIGVYAVTGAGVVVFVLLVDYGVRAFTRWPYSPMSWLASQLVRTLHVPDRTIDKAPKIFAARVGFLFAVVISVLAPLDPMSSLIIGFVLMGFALLEAVLNLCVGCLVYTYVMLPLFAER